MNLSRCIPICFLIIGLGLPRVCANPHINEILTSNGSAIADEDGDHEDWIELHNSGDASVDLSGWGLSDNVQSPFRWRFPDGVSIGAGEFLIIWASGKDRRNPAGELHTNFSLKASGEPLSLSRPDGSLADHVPPVALPRDVSYGRKPDGAGDWFYFSEPTPGLPNGSTAYVGVSGTPRFSHAGGFHEMPFNLELTTGGSGTIYFSFDGSTPGPEYVGGHSWGYKNQYARNPGDPDGPMLWKSIESFGYADPVEIHESLTASPHEYSQINPEFTQAPVLPTGQFPGAVTVRARVHQDGMIPGPVITRTYFPAAAGDGLHELPIISITTDPRGLFGHEYGIYVAGAAADAWRTANPDALWRHIDSANFNHRGRDWERPAAIDFFGLEVGDAKYSLNAGIRIHGGWSRALRIKSLRLYARMGDMFPGTVFPSLSMRGDPENYPAGHERLILRNSGNDWQQSLYRDAMVHRLVEHLPMDGQASRAAVHYLNGEYFGLINIRERIDSRYLAGHHGGIPGDYLILTQSYLDSTHPDDEEHAITGALDFRSIMEFAEGHDLGEPANLDQVAAQVDLDNLALYYAIQVYINNRDWPQNNVKLWRSPPAGNMDAAGHHNDGRWRWFLYDTDWGFGHHGNHTSPSLARVVDLMRGTPMVSLVSESETNRLFRALVQDNPDFRNTFINMLADLMNSTFQSVRVLGKIDEMEGQIASERTRHNARWGIPTSLRPEMRSYAELRPAVMRQHVRDVFFSGEDRILRVNRQGDHGWVRVNSMMIDASLPGIEDPDQPYPWSGSYFSNVPVTLEAIPMPGYQFASWVELPGEESAMIRVTLTEDATFTAVFEEVTDPPGANLPPGVVMDIDRREVVAGRAAAVIDLETVFEDPEGDDMVFQATVEPDDLADLVVTGNTLEIHGTHAGNAVVRITADDHINTPTSTSFPLLVYPEPLALAESDFAFTTWKPDQPAGSFPPHMLFLQGEGNNDSDLTTPLTRAYEIPVHDAADPADVTFPYAATSRTRIRGLGNGGIAFINTGRGRDLGGALVALDTRGVDDGFVTWTGGTLLQNSRRYAIRLQARVGIDEPFQDVLIDGQPQEYIRETTGQQRVFAPVPMDARWLGQEYVQLLWRYYRISGTSGPRDQLSLRDIAVSTLAGPTNYDVWRLLEYPDPEDRGDAAVSGPLAESAGAPNLLRYALGARRDDPAATFLPKVDDQGFYSFAYDGRRRDVTIRVHSSRDLNDWSHVVFDSSVEMPPFIDADGVRIPVDSTGHSNRFYRLSVDQSQR